MQNVKNNATVNYMIRHFLTANIADPLSDTTRGAAPCQEYFSGTGIVGQINYLPRKPTIGGGFLVQVGGTTRSLGSDYLLDSSALTITWTGYNPPSGDDNIFVSYDAVKQWIYDDNPNLTTNTFPRMTVMDLNTDYKIFQLGEYHNYASTAGNWVTKTMKVIIRNRANNNYYDYNGIHYKNMDLVNTIADAVKQYIKTHADPAQWLFYKWDVSNIQRVRTEEDNGIFRADVQLDLTYFDNTTT